MVAACAPHPTLSNKGSLMVSLNLRPGEGRKTGVSRRRRPKTVSLRRLVHERRLRVLNDDDDDGSVDVRPLTRGECRSGPRPCPWMSCRHHLAVDVSVFGALKVNFPDVEDGALPASCALDVAERGGLSLEEVGALLNVTRERARQIEATALQAILRALEEP